MQLNVTAAGAGVALVSFTDNALDINTAQEFRERMKPIIAANKVVLLDMSALGFVDSSGLGALISLLRTLKEKQGELRLFGMSHTVQALFHLVRMHRVFAIFTSQEDALKGLPAD